MKKKPFNIWRVMVLVLVSVLGMYLLRTYLAIDAVRIGENFVCDGEAVKIRYHGLGHATLYLPNNEKMWVEQNGPASYRSVLGSIEVKSKGGGVDIYDKNIPVYSECREVDIS